MLTVQDLKIMEHHRLHQDYGARGSDTPAHVVAVSCSAGEDVNKMEIHVRQQVAGVSINVGGKFSQRSVIYQRNVEARFGKLAR